MLSVGKPQLGRQGYPTLARQFQQPIPKAGPATRRSFVLFEIWWSFERSPTHKIEHPRSKVLTINEIVYRSLFWESKRPPGWQSRRRRVLVCLNAVINVWLPTCHLSLASMLLSLVALLPKFDPLKSSHTLRTVRQDDFLCLGTSPIL